MVYKHLTGRGLSTPAPSHLIMSTLGNVMVCVFSTILYLTYATVEVVESEPASFVRFQDDQRDSLNVINNEIDGNTIPSKRNLTGALHKVVQFNAVNPDDKEREVQLPTSIEVRPDSQLYTEPGEPAQIYFLVTNNRYSPVLYTFQATSQNGFQQVQPQRSYVSPGSSFLVRVTVMGDRSGAGQQASNLITFFARWSSGFGDESVTKKVYIRSGYQTPDSSKPSISYSYNGDCGGFFEPKNCEGKIWRADIRIQDPDAGLLMLRSIPVGLILNKEFIVGTTEEISGHYKATCCLTKVEIIARDIYGNEKSTTIDIERIWLSTGEIIAIVLGSILLVILVILLVLCIIRLCRKRRSLSIYPETR